jgi:hypothetical protein
MAETNSFARSLHDIGLAAWFGGSLMGAVGVNGAAAQVDDPGQRARVASAGWARWTPVNMAAIMAHLIGGTILTTANKGRIAGQRGVARAAIAKGAITLAALGATAYARVLGQRVMNAGDVPVEGATSAHPLTPADVEQAQRQLNLLQWLIPALTGGALALNAAMGEQQRPKEVITGVVKRLIPSKVASKLAEPGA